MMKTYKTLIYTLLFWVLLCTSCTKENLAECLYPYNFSFHYIAPLTKGENSFAKDFGHVHLFIYDAEYLLVDRHDVLVADMVQQGDKYVLEINLPIGDYNVVAWGGKGDDQNHLIQPDAHFSYEYTNTHNSQIAQLNLVHNDKNEVEQLPTPFFHTAEDGLKVTNRKDDEGNTDLNFTWGTNTINVQVELIDPAHVGGLGESTDLSLVNTHITAENGDYNFDKTVSGTDQIIYIPKRTVSPTFNSSDFVVMTLWDGDKSMLIVERMLDGGATKLLYKTSLSELILENPELNFATNNHFDIVIKLLSLDQGTIETQIGITINGYQIIHSNSGIS